MKDNIQVVVNNELCFGCGTCNAVCPVNAIKIDFTSDGRLAPDVDSSACTRCGLCTEVCPGIDMKGRLTEKIDHTLTGQIESVLFGKSTDEEVFHNAQSGGAVTETLSYLFDTGKINAALVVVQERQKACFKIVESKQQLMEAQTSQYTPVDVVSGLPLLSKYKHVAVVGLPCHIEGIVLLKERFPNKYAHIEFLLGLICAGTQSQLTVDVVKNIAKKDIGEVLENEEVRWRQKKFSNYQRADIAIVGECGDVRMLDSNIRHTAKKYFTSPRCRLCFDKLNLYADIVYGDAWGVSGDDTKEGGNVIICRSEKGALLISEMAAANRLKCRPCPIEEIEKGQGMKKKQKTVKSMIALYREKSYQLPEWASSEVFGGASYISKDLRADVGSYWKRSKKPSDKIVREVTREIERQQLIARIKKLIKRTIRK